MMLAWQVCGVKGCITYVGFPLIRLLRNEHKLLRQQICHRTVNRIRLKCVINKGYYEV